MPPSFPANPSKAGCFSTSGPVLITQSQVAPPAPGTVSCIDLFHFFHSTYFIQISLFITGLFVR